MDMWTEKYAPEKVTDLIGQDLAVKDLQKYISSWKPGKGILIYGPSGCGKTSLVEALTKEKGFQLTRLSANEKMGQDEMASHIQRSKQFPLFSKGKYILMDETEAIIRLNRGSSANISTLIKESKFPVFIIVDDVWDRKIRTIKNYCDIVKMKKVHMYDIMKRLKQICEQEGIELNGNPVRSLAKWSQGDMRSAINDLQIVVYGKKSFEDKDLESLGYRERKSNIFSVLPKIFGSKNIKVSRKAIYESDKDSDEIFLWVETNLPSVITKPEDLAKAFDLLSKAEIFRRRVHMKQNWRFKGYMTDLMSGISLFKNEKSGFFQYKMPDRIIMLGRSKANRALRDSVSKKIGLHTHASKKRVRQHLPYYKLIMKKNNDLADALKITEDEKKIL